MFSRLSASHPATSASTALASFQIRHGSLPTRRSETNQEVLQRVAGSGGGSTNTSTGTLYSWNTSARLTTSGSRKPYPSGCQSHLLVYALFATDCHLSARAGEQGLLCGGNRDEMPRAGRGASTLGRGIPANEMPGDTAEMDFYKTTSPRTFSRFIIYRCYTALVNGDDVFDWDAGNEGHVLVYGMEPGEVEEALLDPDGLGSTLTTFRENLGRLWWALRRRGGSC